MSQTFATSLETPRLHLRPMLASDLDGLLFIFADPHVMAAFDLPPFNREQMRQWLERNLEHQSTYGYGLFSVIHKANNLLIGDCGLEQMEVNGTLVHELGYDFRSDYWNEGYATEAAQAVRDFAFDQLRLPDLVSFMRVGNLPSRRVAEKIGMQCSGEIIRYGQQYWHYEIDQKAAT